ncbi:MAG: TraM recognition domain-containing protein [Actinomycetota bacterium]|nr:TraM recognition domain-containing protein [Actinomycetota bacterium]
MSEVRPFDRPRSADDLGADNPMHGERGAQATVIPVPDDGMEFFVRWLIQMSGFQLDGSERPFGGVATGRRSRSLEYGSRGTVTEQLLCRWRPASRVGNATVFGWVVKDGNHQPLAPETDRIGVTFLGAAVQNFLDRRDGWLPRWDPVVPPGGQLTGPWEGQLLDLGGMATEEELRADHRPEGLGKGVLPLGRYAYGYPEATTYGHDLYLGRFGRERMEYRGTLICAPPGAGKSELIVRWAVAAILNGYSTLVVDVKGVLRDEIGRRLQAVGETFPNRTFFFSTNPDTTVVSDRINFLSGLSGTTPVGRTEIEQLARAVLPIEGFDQGEELRLYRNRLAWLTAMIGLVKLHEAYAHEPGSLVSRPIGRDYDLSDVYAMASREATLRRWITEVGREEVRRIRHGQPLLEPGLDHWFDELAVLVNGRWEWQGVDRPPLVGQRADRDPYRYLTQSIVTALQPLSSKGILGRRVSGHSARAGEGVHFRLDELLGDEQVLMILEARELDVGGAEAVVSLAVTHLQLLLNKRHTATDPRPILLLLDETARLRGFDAKKYVALCRSAQAGVVLVYQQLEQIGRPGDDRAATEVLENVGTQVFLGSLAGRNYELFTRQRGPRWQSSFTRTAGQWSSGREHQIAQVESSDVPMFSRIPAGRFPALIYIRDHPCNKAFLVDMDNRFFQDPRSDDQDGSRRAEVDSLRLPAAVRAALAAKATREQ